MVVTLGTNITASIDQLTSNLILASRAVSLSCNGQPRPERPGSSHQRNRRHRCRRQLWRRFRRHAHPHHGPAAHPGHRCFRALHRPGSRARSGNACRGSRGRLLGPAGQRHLRCLRCLCVCRCQQRRWLRNHRLFPPHSVRNQASGLTPRRCDACGRAHRHVVAFAHCYHASLSSLHLAPHSPGTPRSTLSPAGAPVPNAAISWQGGGALSLLGGTSITNSQGLAGFVFPLGPWSAGISATVQACIATAPCALHPDLCCSSRS